MTPGARCWCTWVRLMRTKVQRVYVCEHVWASLCRVACGHAPWLGAVLHGLEPRLNQIQRLEEQRRAGAA